MIIGLLLSFRYTFVPGEIDNYFSMMDKNRDNKLSKEEIQDGFAMFRYFMFMSCVVIIKDLISQFHLYTPGVSVLQFSGSSKPLMPIFQQQAASTTGWGDTQKGST